MVQLRIDIGPAHQATHTNTAFINLSIIPGNNFQVERTNPISLTTTFIERLISISEISWYTKGLTIWASANELSPVDFSLELHPSILIAAGLQITVSIQSGEIEPYSLFFPPGTLPCRGYKIHLDLNDCMNRLIGARTRAPQLFQQQYSQFAFASNQHTSTPQGGTAASHPHSQRIRQVEIELNRQRQEHLLASRLF